MTSHWGPIDLEHDIADDPFANWGRAELWSGVCGTCFRVYRYEVPRSVEFQFVNGIWMRPTHREVREWRAERARQVADLSQHEKAMGLCAFHGDHTGARFADLVDCQFPVTWRPGVVSPLPPDSLLSVLDFPRRGPLPSGTGEFLPDPSGRYRWRCRAGKAWTQWVSFAEHPGETVDELKAGVDDDRIVEDKMGWFDDPASQAPQRFFTGVEWTRWLTDGDRAWCQEGDPQRVRRSEGLRDGPLEPTRDEFDRRVEALVARQHGGDAT
jgi:hypothetical protein